MTNRTDTNLAERLFGSQALLKGRLQRARYAAANHRDHSESARPPRNKLVL